MKEIKKPLDIEYQKQNQTQSSCGVGCGVGSWGGPCILL